VSGVEKKTIAEYRRYLSRDIEPMLGHIPLSTLSRTDISRWVKPSVESPVGEATERSVTRVKPAASLDIEGEPSRAVHGEGHGSGEDPGSAAARDSPA
jgi:hypothetical protein